VDPVNEVAGAPLGLEIKLPDILPDDADADQLDAAEKIDWQHG
jgi:hypothetical protein